MIATYLPMRAEWLLFIAYREALAANFLATGRRLEDRSLRQAATELLLEDFGENPSRPTRTSSLGAVALSGMLVSIFAALPLSFAFSWLGLDPGRNFSFAVGSLASAWSLVCLGRFLMDHWDHQRWIAAGRPDGWVPWGPAQPKSRDLLAVLLVAWVMPVLGILSAVP